MTAVAIKIDTSGLNLQSVADAVSIKGNAADTALQAGAAAVLEMVRTRIHEEGKAADGSTIGSYSTRPFYVNPGKVPGQFSPVGKTGKTVFTGGKKKGQAHKTAWFAGGYAAFKAETQNFASLQGVNLYLTGALCSQLQLMETPTGWALGWTDEELTQRALALEARYGKQIWALTEGEEEKIVGSLQLAVGNIRSLN